MRIQVALVTFVCAFGLCDEYPGRGAEAQADALPKRAQVKAEKNVQQPSEVFEVVDLHVDLPYQLSHHGRDFDLGTGQFSLQKILKANVKGVVLPLFVSASGPKKAREKADFEALYAKVYAHLIDHPRFLPPGCNSQPGRIQTWLSFEGADPLGPEDIKLWAARGVRVFGLVHNLSNPLMSAAVSSDEYGVTEKGRKVMLAIREANGILDVSHASDQAVTEATTYAKQTGLVVVATHSNTRALAKHRRNLSDALMRKIAETGGVIGINFHQPFVGNASEGVGVEHVVRHIEHAVKVVGEAHVAIGSDFEGDIRPVSGLEDAEGFPRLSEALLARGMARSTIRKIFSENALRVLCRGPY